MPYDFRMNGPRWSDEGRRLGELIAQHGFDRPEFARQLGISDDVLSNLCRGVTRLTGDRRTMAADILGIDPATLREALTRPPLTRRSPLPDASTVNVRGKIVVVPTGMSPIPIYSSVPASRPGRTFSDAADVEFMPDWDLDVPHWGTFVSGSSMEDEFENGDIVIFEERQPLPMQAVYAQKDGEETFKILRPRAEGFELWPLNPDHSSFSAEGWEVRGVVIRRIRYRSGGRKSTEDYPPTYTFRIPY